MNDSKSSWVIEQVQARASFLEDQLGRPSRIGCLGLAFKPDVDDLRESSTQLRRSCWWPLEVCEPNIHDHPTIKLHTLQRVLADADLLVFLVAHSPFRNLDLTGRAVFDLCGVTGKCEVSLSAAYQQTAGFECAAVAAHRVAMRAGIYERQRNGPCPCLSSSTVSPKRSHFSRMAGRRHRAIVVLLQPMLLAGTATWFSHESHRVGSPPDWFLDPLPALSDGAQHWSRCRPFSGVDIKRCWELSRWGWAPLLIRSGTR